MQKKIWLYLLVLSLFLGVMSIRPCVAANQVFPDIEAHWAKDYISQLTGLGYMGGYPDGTFKPDKSMTRAEFTSVLISCMGITASDKTSRNFSDTTGNWAIASINEAVKLGILVPSEYPKGLVPDGGIKRSEACAMLVRALGKSPTSGITTFKDDAKVQLSDYHAYIKTTSDLGIMGGFPTGNFEPFTEMPRAQACTVLYKLLVLQGKVPATPNPTSTTTPAITVSNGSIKYVAIGDELYDIKTIPVSFIINYQEVPVNNIVASTASITVNSTYSLDLNSSDDNPDIMVSKNRYEIDMLTVSGDKLVVSVGNRKLAKFEIDGYTYNSDYVKLYVNSSNQGYYLSDMSIVDEYQVKIADQSYKLNTDKISIAINSPASSTGKPDFYDIKEINLNKEDTTLKLVATDAVVMDHLSISDIGAVFINSRTINLSASAQIAFVIGGKKYTLAEVTVDAKGNFSGADKVYPYSQVLMAIDDMQYKIKDLQINQSKFIIYCGEGSDQEWVIVNDEYRDAAGVKIIKGTSTYSLDEALVVGKNLIRINGKKYPLDSDFKCQVDNKLYEIDKIYYDSDQGATIIDTGNLADTSLAVQPNNFVFYSDDVKYQEGSKGASIYTDSEWLSFGEIFISDPSHFVYQDKTYELIGAEIKINEVSFAVIDTSWHGATQVLDIYLQKQ